MHFDDFQLPYLIMKAYDVAIKEKYKFGAYGDAMLVIRK